MNTKTQHLCQKEQHDSFMRKNALPAVSTLLLSGCFFHPAEYETLSVRLKNNTPCFSLPSDQNLIQPITSGGPTVLLKKDAEWQTISPPSIDTPMEIIMTEDCQLWPGIDWVAGEYNVVVKITSEQTSARYMAKFQLQNNGNGRFTL